MIGIAFVKGGRVPDLENLEMLFVIDGFLFQRVLISHFAVRKWRFDLAIQYGPIVYALSLPVVFLSIALMLDGKPWALWLSGILYFVWAALGLTVEYLQKIEWRNSKCWPVFIPYVGLYLATVMFYWFPLALIYKPLWYGYSVLFAVSTILNVSSHQAST